MPLEKERIFTILEDGTIMSFAKGYKDYWCVYYYTEDTEPTKPRDQDYFDDLLKLANKFGPDYVYEDFVKVYEHTDNIPNPWMVEFIKALVIERYKEDEDYYGIVKLFLTLYMAMVAEYYYVNRFGRPSRLKKRTKRLGIYQFLFGGLTVEQAKEYSKGRDFAELDALCKEYGF